MGNARLEEAQAGSKIAGRNINNLIYADDTTLMAESEEELKSLLMKVKRGEWKSWLKAQHSENLDHGTQSHHFIANSWGNGGNCGWLYFWRLQNHCRWRLKQWNKKTLLGGKVMTNLDSILKSRDITLSTKVHLVKAIIFPVVMYGCESWTIKMLLNCGVGEDSWESLGLQGDPTSPFWSRSALGFLWKEWC